MFPLAPVPVICGKLEGNAGTISLGCWAPLDAWAWTGFGASLKWQQESIRCMLERKCVNSGFRLMPTPDQHWWQTCNDFMGAVPGLACECRHISGCHLSLPKNSVYKQSSSLRMISVTSALIGQSHFTLHIRRRNMQKSCMEFSQTHVKMWGGSVQKSLLSFWVW